MRPREAALRVARVATALSLASATACVDEILLRSRADATADAPVDATPDAAPLHDTALGDVDEDGDADLVLRVGPRSATERGTLELFRAPAGPRVAVYTAGDDEFAPTPLGVGRALAAVPFPAALLVGAPRRGAEDPEGGFLARPSVLLLRTESASAPLGALTPAGGRFACMAGQACDATSLGSQAAFR